MAVLPRFPVLFAALLALGSASALRAADAPLPYVLRPAFAGVSFEQPLGMVTPPGETNRLFVLEKPGRILVISDLAHPQPTVFLDLRDKVGDDEIEQGVLALAFHPDYAHNRQFYVWYTSCHRRGLSTVREDRLSRFLVSADNPNVADAASEQQLLAQADQAPNHNGGELLFGPDGYLYLSLGDEGNANDSFENSQRIDKNYFAGILRLDVDQRPGNLRPHPHPAVFPGTYLVPRDNPYVTAHEFNGKPVNPLAVRTEFWAVGLRNPWRMSFDPATGKLWVGDVGQNLFEEIDIIKRGGNYGWNYREAYHPFEDRTPPPGVTFDEPIWEYAHGEGICITGGLVYHGARYPELEGKYVFADYGTGRIWALTPPEGDQRVKPEQVRLIARHDGLVSFARDPRNGDILIAAIYEHTIYRLMARAPQ